MFLYEEGSVWFQAIGRRHYWDELIKSFYFFLSTGNCRIRFGFTRLSFDLVVGRPAFERLRRMYSTFQ